MAGKNKEDAEKKEFADEKKLGELMNKIHAQLADEMKGRPYLLAVTTGYEIGKEGEMSKFAAQWAWRSNVYVNKEDGKKIVEFLADQLKDVVDHPQGGVKKQYGIQ